MQIPTLQADKPYSICIIETISAEVRPAYQVEIYDNETEAIEVVAIGSLAECSETFSMLKAVYTKEGHYVREVGTNMTRRLKPRHMFVNYPVRMVSNQILWNLENAIEIRRADEISKKVLRGYY